MRSRAGDEVGVDKSRWFQPNRFLDSFLLRAAYLQIGQQTNVRQGIDNTHKELVMLSAASVARGFQEKWIRGVIKDQLVGPRRPLFINRFCDCTPWQLSFGRLQSVLMPMARYFHWDDDLKRWQVMALDEYQKKHHSCNLIHTGTLDVMASAAEIHWVLPNYEAHAARLMLAPQIVEKGNASTIHSALEQGAAAVKLDAIRTMAASCPWVILNEQPDACPSNGRRQAQVMEMCADLPNVLHTRGRCGSHQAQRIIATTVAGSCGDAHAVGEACCNLSHAAKMQESLQKLCASARIYRCEPLESNARRNQAIVRSTLRRRREFICDDGPSSHLDRQNEYCAAKKFLRTWNGDWQMTHIEYYCPLGCGPDRTDEGCRKALYASCVEVDILCSKESTGSLDEWGSCSDCSGKIPAGLLVHRILPQVFADAMSSWSKMLPAEIAGSRGDMDSVQRARLTIQKKKSESEVGVA